MNEYVNESSYSYYGRYRTRKFTDIFPDANTFLNEYNGNGIPTTINSESELTPTLLYYLLYANYGNSHIASSDENRFKYKLFSIVWQYAPTVDKELNIQKKLRTLSDDELIKGSKQIYNTASHPGTDPATTSEEELQYIDNQNTTNNMRGKLEAYEFLTSLLKKDVTAEFLNRFKDLFLKYVEPQEELLYGEVY